MNQTQSIHKGINSDQLSITNPMWEVNTARLQASINNGACVVNARLCEEERAAKAGLAAPVDTAYVAAHQADYTGKPASAQKRVGSFMAVGLVLNKNSQKNSALCPFDSDIGVKKLKDWKLETKSGLQLKLARACERTGVHNDQRIREVIAKRRLNIAVQLRRYES